jgi:hypothetical protein
MLSNKIVTVSQSLSQASHSRTAHGNKQFKSIGKTGKRTETIQKQPQKAACLHTLWPDDATDTGRNGATAAAAACTLWGAERGGAFDCSLAGAWRGLEVEGGGAEASCGVVGEEGAANRAWGLEGGGGGGWAGRGGGGCGSDDAAASDGV